MIEWLRRGQAGPPTLELGGVRLPVIVRRLTQAKRMTLRLAPDGSEVRVSLPRWGTTAEALAFARSKLDWLERQRAAIPATTSMGAGSRIAFRGELLTIVHDPKVPRRPAREGDSLRVGGPAEGLETRLRRWLEDIARAAVHQDLAHYCARAGVPLPKLALSNARRRWGSCAARGTIRINWRLIMAPDFVRQSVVAHEVAHLIHFDHSPRFHALLEELYEGDMAKANKWLKTNGRGLYAVLG